MGVWSIQDFPIEVQSGYEDTVVFDLAAGVHIGNISDNEIGPVDVDVVALITELPQIGIKID
jgi:hypothetical protein